MAYVIAEPCIGKKEKACVPVCPVDCIWWLDPTDKYMLVNNAGEKRPMNPQVSDKKPAQLFIEPSACIDCFACADACPWKAIYEESDVPPHWASYVELNREAFQV